MKNTSDTLPEACDGCGLSGDLHWNDELNKWLCEFCEEFAVEEEWECVVEKKESSKYVGTGMNWEKEAKQNKKYNASRPKYKRQRKENRNEF